MNAPYDLEWDTDDICSVPIPKWVAEPNHDIISRITARHLPYAQVEGVILHDEGTFNKIYKVETSHGYFAFRVALPISSPHKVASEVATMKFLQRVTNSPVPTIFAYDASTENELRFPWILMTFIQGYTLSTYWRHLTDTKKEKLICQVARLHVELFEHRFSSLGGLYPPDRPTPRSATLAFPASLLLAHLGLVSIYLVIGLWTIYYTLGSSFSDRHAAADGLVGPLLDCDYAYMVDSVSSRDLPNTHAWLQNRLVIAERQLQANRPSGSKDGVTDPDLVRAQQRWTRKAALHKRMIEILPRLFPVSVREETILAPRDLHSGNIMVNEEGDLVAILDWEFTSVLPLWYACRLPKLVHYGRQRYMPILDDDEEADEEYYSDMMNYEMFKTYQPLFLSEIERLQPHWVSIYNAAKAEDDFESAIFEIGQWWGRGEDDEIWMSSLEGKLAQRGPLNVANPKAIEGLKRRIFDASESCVSEDGSTTEDDDSSDCDSEAES